MTSISPEMNIAAPRGFFRTFRTAIELCLYQLILVLAVTGGRYSRLVNWDASWYRDIATLGYKVSLPLPHDAGGGSNIAFFPGFPLWTRFIQRIFNLDGNVAVALAAQLAAVGLWTYFLLLLKRLRIQPWLGAVLVVALLVQPGAFYYVIGYSESLFTFSLLGMIYWTDRFFRSERSEHSTLFFFFAALHGGILSSTRFLGVALAVFPLLLTLLQRRRVLVGLALSALNLSGFAGYLLYCQLRFGHWNIYWEANRVGWGVYFDPFKLLHLSYYTDVFFVGNLSEILGRILTVLSLGALLAVLPILLKDFLRKVPHAEASDALPGAMALLNLGLMLETIVGSHGMHSMVRYLLPIHALLFPLVGLWWQRRSRELSLRPTIVMGALLFFLFSIQILFAIRYSRGEWVS